jgi:hypothetical protein
MTRRLGSAWLGAVLLAALAVPARATAKPPDLPTNETETVAPPGGQEEQEESPAPVINWWVAPAEGVSPAAAPRQAGPEGTGAGRDTQTRLQEAPTGCLLFGLGVNSDTGLTGSVILYRKTGMVTQTSPIPGLAHLLPGVRRRLASSLLFGVHPLLALAPLDHVLDFPSDHPQPAQVELLFGDMPTPPIAAFCGATADELARCDRNRETDWLRWMLRHWSACAASEDGSGGCSCAAPCGLRGLPLSMNPPDSAHVPDSGCPAQPAPAPEAGPTCPYLKQQAAERHAPMPANPDLGPDVLENLKRLRKANRLIRQGEELAREGHACEALGCFAKALHLCPGRYDERLAGDLIEIAADLHGCQGGEPARKPQRDIESRLKATVNLSLNRVPLRTAIENLRDWSGINIRIDEPALKEAGVDLENPVSMKLEQVSLKSALNLLLGEMHLTCAVKDGVVEITTEHHPAKPECCEGGCCPGCPGCRKQHAEEADRAGVAVQVARLMKACHLALSSGQPDRAAALAREAFALDPERVQGDPVVYKMHLLASHPEEASYGRDGAEHGCSSHCPCCPGKQPANSACQTGSCPSKGQPSVDPHTATEEQEPGAAAHEPCSPLPACSTAPEPESRGKGCDREGCCAGEASATGSLDDFLEDYALPRGSSIELSFTWDCIRLSCDVPLGGSVYHLLYDRGACALWVTPGPAAEPSAHDAE